MATFTWVGGATDNFTDSTQWNPTGVPAAGDTIIIADGKSVNFVPATGSLTLPLTNNTINVAGGTGDVITYVDVVSTGGSFTSGDSTAFGGFVWNITDSTLDTASITLGNFSELNLTGSASNSMQIKSSGNTQSMIKQTGAGDQLRINATGTVNEHANLFLEAAGGTATLNVAQNGTAAGFYDAKSALLVIGDALSITGDANTSTRFSNNSFFLIAGIGAQGSATLDARMNSITGFIDLLGAANGASLDDNTNMPGGQTVSFGDANGLLKIEANNTLSSAFDVVTGSTTVSTTVLDSFFSRVTGFKPGSTIELVGVNPTGLTWSFGNDPNFGNDVLTINNGTSEVARIRFAGENLVDGTGTVGGANTTNFVLANDGSGDTLITLANTVTVSGSIVVTGTVAQWGGVTNGATTDWSAANWTGGVGAGGIPGQFQTAQISLTQNEGSAAAGGTFTNYVLTISTAETAGAVVFDDPFATLEISAPLVLQRITLQTDGSGFHADAGLVDIQNGGTVSALRFFTNSGLSLEPGALLSIAGNAPFTFGSGLAGLDVEKFGQATGATISSSGNITVGANANGNFTAENNIVGQSGTVPVFGTLGSAVFATYTQVGGNSILTGADQPQSSLQISGPNTTWFDTNTDASTPLDGAMIVGGGAPSLTPLDQVVNFGGGVGMVDISNGALVVERSYAILGATRTSQGTVNVESGGTWMVGTGDVATPGSIVFGNSIVGTSTIFGSNLPQLVVGSGGAGTLNVNSGAVILGGAAAFDSFRMFIGTGNNGNATATGVVNVQGPGALLNANGPVDVSHRSNGTLNVGNGGTVEVANDTTTADFAFGLIIGNQAGTVGATSGVVNVNSGGLLTDNGDLVDGRNSAGTLNVGGGSVQVSGGLYLGGFVSLNNGTTATAPTLFRGASHGVLSVSGGGVMTVGSGTLDMWQGTTASPAPSTVDVAGSGELVLGNPGTTVPLTGELTVVAGATLEGAGTVAVSSGDSILRNFGTVLAGGLSSGGTPDQFGATLELSAVLAGPGVFALAQGATLELNNGVVNTSSFDFGVGNFGTATGHFERIRADFPTSFQGTVGDFYSPGNGIDFVGAGFQGQQPTYTPNADASTGGTVDVVTGAGTLTFQVTGPHPLGFSASADGATTGTEVTANDVFPCFAAGTRILTAAGEAPVEELSAGDAVPTHSGAMRRVRWIGRTRVELDRRMAPVVVQADAFGPGAPHRALVLSPDHAVLVGEVLVPIRYLANGASIAWAEANCFVDYFHVELDRHDVLFAEGLAAESYLDTGNRSQFANGEETDGLSFVALSAAG